MFKIKVALHFYIQCNITFQLGSRNTAMHKNPSWLKLMKPILLGQYVSSVLNFPPEVCYGNSIYLILSIDNIKIKIQEQRGEFQQQRLLGSFTCSLKSRRSRRFSFKSSVFRIMLGLVQQAVHRDRALQWQRSKTCLLHLCLCFPVVKLHSLFCLTSQLTVSSRRRAGYSFGNDNKDHLNQGNVGKLQSVVLGNRVGPRRSFDLVLFHLPSQKSLLLQLPGTKEKMLEIPSWQNGQRNTVQTKPQWQWQV